MSRTAWIVSGSLAALLAVVVVLLIVVISQNSAAERERDHARIVAACEPQFADPYGEDLQAMTDCMDRLGAGR